MSEEQKMILNMVAEGKITPEEGVTLLEAVKESQKPKAKTIEEEFKIKMPFPFMDDPFKESFDTSPKTAKALPGTKLVIESHFGQLKLIGTDEENIKVTDTARSQYELLQKEEKVYIKSRWPGGQFTVHIPKTVTHLKVKSHTGQVVAKNLPNTLEAVEINTHTGHARIETQTLVQGIYRLQSKVGQIELYIPPASACEINAACRMGAVDCDLPLDVTEESFNLLKGTLNGGGTNIKIVSQMGHIKIGAKN